MKMPFRLPSITDIILAVAGAMLCGLGCGFINYTSLGMDAIGLFYDGIRNVLNLSPDQIGTASYVVCIILSVFLLLVERKYVSFGSVIYIIMYGAFANLGTLMWEHLISDAGLFARIIITVSGLLILYVGLGIYIAIDIGVDAFTGVMLWLCNVTHKEMKYVKIVFDLGLAVVGTILGGTLGPVTPVTILIGGPCISFFTKHIQSAYFKGKIRKTRNEENNADRGT